MDGGWWLRGRIWYESGGFCGWICEGWFDESVDENSSDCDGCVMFRHGAIIDEIDVSEHHCEGAVIYGLLADLFEECWGFFREK